MESVYKYWEQMKARYDRNRSPVDLKPGDFVLVRLSDYERNKFPCRKLAPRWSEPREVVKVLTNKATYVVKSANGSTESVNIVRLLPLTNPQWETSPGAGEASDGIAEQTVKGVPESDDCSAHYYVPASGVVPAVPATLPPVVAPDYPLVPESNDASEPDREIDQPVAPDQPSDQLVSSSYRDHHPSGDDSPVVAFPDWLVNVPSDSTEEERPLIPDLSGVNQAVSEASSPVSQLTSEDSVFTTPRAIPKARPTMARPTLTRAIPKARPQTRRSVVVDSDAGSGGHRIVVASETSVAERGTERPHDITNVGGTLPADSSIRRVLFDSPCTSGSDLYTNSSAATSSHHTIDSLASDVFEPESILDRRDKGDGTPQYLVHWKGCEHS